eukprot:5754623-Pyramimonas_sp.AAC.1
MIGTWAAPSVCAATGQAPAQPSKARCSLATMSYPHLPCPLAGTLCLPYSLLAAKEGNDPPKAAEGH